MSLYMSLSVTACLPVSVSFWLMTVYLLVTSLDSAEHPGTYVTLCCFLSTCLCVVCLSVLTSFHVPRCLPPMCPPSHALYPLVALARAPPCLLYCLIPPLRPCVFPHHLSPPIVLYCSPGASISDFLLDLVDEDTVVVPGYRGARGMTALVSQTQRQSLIHAYHPYMFRSVRW